MTASRAQGSSHISEPKVLVLKNASLFSFRRAGALVMAICSSSQLGEEHASSHRDTPALAPYSLMASLWFKLYIILEFGSPPLAKNRERATFHIYSHIDDFARSTRTSP